MLPKDDMTDQSDKSYVRLLADRVRSLRAVRHPVVVGLTGSPGAGKSTLAARLVAELSADQVAAYMPMDGFHLSNNQLVLLDKRNRKGAIDTFDAYGYLALLRRLRVERDHTVFAPAFPRSAEEPIAASIAIEPGTSYVITEGNYLLSDLSPWNEIRAELDEVWFLDLPAEVRRGRLRARHVEYGKSPQEADRWVRDVDEANARRIEICRDAADFVVDMSLVGPQKG